MRRGKLRAADGRHLGYGPDGMEMQTGGDLNGVQALRAMFSVVWIDVVAFGGADVIGTLGAPGPVCAAEGLSYILTRILAKCGPKFREC